MKAKTNMRKTDLFESIKYDTTDSPVLIFQGVLSEIRNYPTRRHWHNDVEFVKIISGSISYNINGETITLKPGDCLFINARQFHYNFPDNDSECVFMCVILHPGLMCPSNNIAEKYVSPVLSNTSLPYYIFKDNSDWENNVTNSIEQIYNLKDEDGFELKLYSIFFKMWKDIYINLSNKNSQKSHDTQHIAELKNMVSYIKNHYKERISLYDIANAGGACKTSCYTIFKKFTNQTPGEYLTEYRLQKSIELMQNTDMTFTQICYEVGFSGASYYAETFKKFFGVSPSTYKKTYQKKDLS